MYSMAQQAVAKGYGKMEYFRAQPIALSSRVRTMASPSSADSPEETVRGGGGARDVANGETGSSAAHPASQTTPSQMLSTRLVLMGGW